MILKEIQSIQLLSDIDRVSLEKHIKNNNMYVKQYPKGLAVHDYKELCKTLDVVLKGSLVAYLLSENGSTTVVFEFQKGSILGANLLFGENREYPLNIYCLDDCELLHIKQTAVSELLYNYNFVMQYIKSLSQNSQGMNQKIAMFTQKSLRENVLEYLKQQSLAQKSDTITLPISKKQLADYLGVQRPSLFRELKKMKDEEIIDINNRNIKILSHEKGQS